MPRRSTFRYTIVNGSARVLSYFTSLSCTRLSIARSSKTEGLGFLHFSQQALIRFALIRCQNWTAGWWVKWQFIAVGWLTDKVLQIGVFADLFDCWTIANSQFYLIINAPNAIRKDLAAAPITVGKFSASSDSNSDHGMSWAIFTQRLKADNFPPKGSSKSDGGLGASSNFRYKLADGDAWVLTYFSCFSGTTLLFSVRQAIKCILFQFIQQALIMPDKIFNYLEKHITCNFS